MMNETKKTVASVSLVVGLVAAVFVLVTCAMLTATHLQIKKADPLSNTSLLELRDRYADGERGDQMKSDIRQLDLLSRKAFFTAKGQIRAGGVAAVVAGVLAVVAFMLYQLMGENVPPVKSASCEGMFWIGVQRSRVWIGGGTILLVALSVVMATSTPTTLSSTESGMRKPEELAEANRAPNEGMDEPARPLLEPVAAQSADVAVFPEGFSDNAPIFRGAAGSGMTSFEGVPTAWSESESKNMLWKQALELPAWASPVVWGDRVFALGADAERRMAYCRNATTGAEIWTVEIPVHEEATEYTAETMDERWDTLVYAGATPAVNGKQAFALFSNGQLVALDLASGKVLWNIVPAQTSANTYGLDNSLLIYKDSVIVVFEGDESFVARYKAETGEEVWRTVRDSSSWASPVLARRGDGSYLVVLPADPDLTAWDPDTGEQVWSTDVLTGGPEYCVGPSPVQVGDLVCVNCQNCGIYGVKVEDGSIAWSLEELPDGSGFPDGAGMTTDGKHLYQFYESVLTCVDGATGQVVKQKELDEYSCYASALLNAGKLYLPCDGVVLVLNSDPASDFDAMGKGEMEDYSDATPAIVAGRVYVRSDEALYCFGEM